jgi:hypothetical protein
LKISLNINFEIKPPFDKILTDKYSKNNKYLNLFNGKSAIIRKIIEINGLITAHSLLFPMMSPFIVVLLAKITDEIKECSDKVPEICESNRYWIRLEVNNQI